MAGPMWAVGEEEEARPGDHVLEPFGPLPAGGQDEEIPSVSAARRGHLKILIVLLAVLTATGGVLAQVHLSRQKLPRSAQQQFDVWRPPPGGYFSLAPVGAYRSLPDDRQAAAAVHHSTWEIRPQNRTFNQVTPRGLKLTPVDPRAHSYDPRWNRYILGRVSGAFTGTTDEILQWSAAKWGLPDEVLRTIAVMESDWDQTNSGDEVPAADCPYRTDRPTCLMTFGLLGVNSRSFAGIFPWNRDSTAANADMLGAWLRGCYNGWIWWLRDHGNRSGGTYRAGDLWGCVGAWFSGDWYDGLVGQRSAVNYITRAQRWYDLKPWLRPNY